MDAKLDRVNGSCNRFTLHLKATILKRVRVIRRDIKSFLLEILLPMVIIIFALLLMQISFIADSPERKLSLKTYSDFSASASPLQVPIGSGNAALLNSMESGLSTKYGSKLSLKKDTTSTSADTFDQNFLYPKKSNVKFLMGGIFFNGQSTLMGDTIY